MKEQPWSVWEQRWKTTLSAIEDRGGEVSNLTIKPSVPIEQITLLEQELEVKLPTSLIRVLTEYSSEVQVSWSLPDEENRLASLPPELDRIFRGELYWSLDQLGDIERNRRGWQEAVFPNPDDSYDFVWHHKLAFMEVGNGDFIAFDLSEPDDYPVVYLSHDAGDGHGYRLGDNFIDFVDRCTLIGCVGPEDWQLMTFIDSPRSGIDPHGEYALKWKSWLTPCK